MPGSMIEQLLAASRGSHRPAAPQPVASGNGNSTAADPYNLSPYDPVKAHDDGTAFYDHFVIDIYQGKTRVFFSGCIAYNRTVNAILANLSKVRPQQQESILRATLAEWKKRLLAGPMDDFGKQHWELGMQMIEFFSHQIHVVEGDDLVRAPRPGWDEKISPSFASLVQGRHPGELVGLGDWDDFRLTLVDWKNPQSAMEMIGKPLKRENADN
ncbi:hypothetical protein BKA70DRAFT_87835 [Coprinopsis sp. MPI-PUGE-AT-0042]|nr:hypothetical protein BKA70DRAFT_87835 [Coprinopsis sp. MPI-PUGE-AT-0042]